ncbi:MAG: LptF/LptG family permease [Thermoguttaceae bacterium]|jgi:lipopolysaccharide export system permease protein
MRIIDRYLLRQFVQTFLICYFSLTGVYVVFDVFTNLEAFLHCARGGQLLRLMGWYYGFQSIFFFDRTCSLLVLMSAMFTVAWIQRHNEMTALMAAGISRIRIVAPVLVAGVVITLAAAVNRETIIPRFKDELAQRPGDLQGNATDEAPFLRDYETDVILRGRAAYIYQRRIEKPDFLLPQSLGQYGNHLVADSAYYQPPSGDRPGGYLLDGVQDPKSLAGKPSLVLEGRPVVITPRDAAGWLGPQQCFVASDVTFDQLTGGRAFRAFGSTVEMVRALRNRAMEYGADLRVTIHARLVQPLLDLTLLLLGLPLVVSRESRNVFLAIGLGMGVVALFLSLVIGCQQLGASGLVGPALAAWAPLMICVPAAVGTAETMWQR